MQIVAVAEFTDDMAATLAEYFEAYAVEGVVSIEVTTHGLWLKNPAGGRQFLGLARIPQSSQRRDHLTQ
ncbi:hypothetical protein [uncultured Brevundimonas sp.]|uniref:hypothetical protein n=1 Tax=uncultured Brevundimonas sp. TaxID=213418 RepID=UPI00260DA04D|nr:hypothetical protein [uncultured Brevundimonas sp.]